jgi:N-acyl-L-homoserine lactone synthetase
MRTAPASSDQPPIASEALQHVAKLSRLTISVAAAAERKAIYRFRHEVFAHELGQHSTNSSGCLRDSLDDRNVYLVAKAQDEIAGFISIIPSLDDHDR